MRPTKTKDLFCATWTGAALAISIGERTMKRGCSFGMKASMTRSAKGETLRTLKVRPASASALAVATWRATRTALCNELLLSHRADRQAPDMGVRLHGAAPEK